MINQEPLSTSTNDSERALEASIRPKRIGDYIGQSQVREQMELFITAATQRQEALDHTLLFGPPGLGKTTLAQIIANEMNAPLRQSSGPVLDKAGDLAAVLTNLEPDAVLFIDEIHRLNPAVEEILYPALEDYQLDIIIGEGPAARSIKIDLPRFTLVGATTRAGLLTSPLRDRFGIVQHLQYYSPADLAQIVTRSAHILHVPIVDEGAHEIARRSRGTPRIANRLLRRVRDYAQVKADGHIDQNTACQALDMLCIDHLGLDQLDRKFLAAIVEKFNGGPVGIDSIGAAISEERGTLEDTIEPYLIQQGYVQRTSRGRIATPQCYQLLGIPHSKPSATGDLFERPK